ncbi:YciI family protein [Sinomicrobium sp. M5D2P17]
MNEFLLIFRRDFMGKDIQPSPNELQKHLEHWQEWFGTLKEQDKLAAPLKRWDGKGMVVNNKGVTNGPYVEVKESIGGMIMVKAKDYEEAAEIASGCPILELGGNVEIRMAAG